MRAKSTFPLKLDQLKTIKEEEEKEKVKVKGERKKQISLAF